MSALRPFDEAVLDIIDDHGIPGASLAVAREGEVVLARGYGWADTAKRVPVRPGHRFRIASVSKPITATAVLKLVRDGRLQLHDRPFRLLGLPSSGGLDPRLEEVTVLHLLRHRGGFDRTEGLDPTLTPGLVADRLGVAPPVGLDQIIRFMVARPLDFDPGARTAYSNFGYAVLGRVIEEASGTDYEDYVRREVLEPSGAGGMTLGFSFPNERPSDEVAYHHPPPPRTVPAIPPRTGEVALPDGGFDLRVIAAHGGWTATPTELVRFLLAVDGVRDPPDVLSSELIALMRAPPSAGTPDTAYYGAGWIVEPDRTDPETWWHPGDLPGTMALLMRSGPTAWALLLNGSPWGPDAHAEAIRAIKGAARAIDDWPS